MSIISAENISRLVTGTIGSELAVYDVIDSTNNAAKLLAKNGAPHGAAVVAKQQTAGKGRLGRGFYSPEGSGIYMTVILRPQMGVEESLLVTPAAAVAVSDAILQETGLEVKIKWVNDLYCGGRKLCGILAESAVGQDGRLDYIVVGIGINVTTDSFPAELCDKATSLSSVCKQTPDSNRLIAAVLNHFDKIYGQLHKRTFMELYRSRSCVIGKQVSVLGGTDMESVTVLDIDSNANLIVETQSGVRKAIGSGEVSLKGDWQ